MPSGFLLLLTVYARYQAVWGVANLFEKLASSPVGRRSSTPQVRRGIPKQHVNEQMLAGMVSEYEAGATVYELEAKYRVDRDRVSKLLKGAGVRVRDHERVEVDLARAAELQAQGMNLTEVAKTMRIGRTTLVRARRAARGQKGRAAG